MAKLNLFDFAQGQGEEIFWEDREARYSFDGIKDRALAHSTLFADVAAGSICALSGFSPLEIWVLMLSAWNKKLAVLPFAADATQASIDLALNQLPWSLHLKRRAGPGTASIPVETEKCARAFSATAGDVFIMTSGSTGVPKAISHHLDGLAVSARATLAFYEWQPRASWLLSLDPSHIGGLQILLRVWLGRGLCFYGGAPKDVGLALQSRACDYLSLVPTQLIRLLEEERNAQPLRKAKAILLGGAAAQTSLLDEIRQRRLAVSITYGSSETASQITGFKPGDIPKDKEDVGNVLGIWDVAASAEGDLWIKGPALMLGYWQNQLWFPLTEKTYLLSDQGRLVAGRLYLEGRRDQVFQVGGENVAPAEILRAIESIYPVSDLLVMAKVDATFGFIPLLIVRSRYRPKLSALLEALVSLPPIKRPREIWWFQTDEVSKLSKAHLEHLLSVEDDHMQRLWKYEKI